MPLPMYRSASTPAKQPLLRGFNPPSTPPCWIAIAAGKGGVGKSTVTLQLARSFAAQGRKVGILDADLYGPSMRQMLPEETLPGRKEGKLTPARCGNVKLLSLAYFRPQQESIAVRAPIANQLISHFLTEVDWGDCDLILVDFPPGTGDIQLTLSQKVRFNGAILVTTPQLVSLLDVRKSAHFFQQVQIPLLGIIENMSYYFDAESEKAHYLFGKAGGRQLSEELGVKLLGEVPISPALCKACDLGTSLFEETSLDAQIIQRVFKAITDQLMHTREIACHEEVQEISQILFPKPGWIEIFWKEGKPALHSLRALQRQCPCAACEGLNKGSAEVLDPPLFVDQVIYMGRYGLRFDFQSGCSLGLYPFSLLRAI